MKGNFAIVIQIRLVKRRMISLSNSLNAFSWRSKNSLFLSHRSHHMCVCVSECIGWSGPLCILQSDLLPLGLPGLAYNCPPLQIVTSLACPSPLLFFPLFILSDFRLLWVIIHQWGPPALRTRPGGPWYYASITRGHFWWRRIIQGNKRAWKCSTRQGVNGGDYYIQIIISNKLSW